MGVPATAAQAEFGYALTVASDDRFRGATTSDHLPVGTLAISYDDRTGIYAGASATVGPVRGDGVRVLRSVQYLGYARRVTPSVSLDFGISNRLYDRRSTVEYGRRFAQLYAGLVGRKVSSHFFYAADYDGLGNPASYLQVDASLFERGRLSLTSHAGALRPPRGERYGRSLEYDWRLGATRRIGARSSVSVNWVGGGPEADEEPSGQRWRGAIVFSASRSF